MVSRAPSPGFAGTEADLEARFDRHFALRQARCDVIGTTFGTAMYVCLLHPLLAQHDGPGGRPWLLAAGALVCGALCAWPMLLQRLGRWDVYARHRDVFFMLHFAFHYGVGAQLARFIRMVHKLPHGSAPSFLIGFIFSTTAPWQAVDTLLYRMRFHRFLLLKPVVLLAALPLEWDLCKQTCSTMPDQAAYFGRTVDTLRLLLSPFGALHASSASPEGPVVSCFKAQLFLLVLTAFMLPAVVMHYIESDMWAKFGAEQQLEYARAVVPLFASYPPAAAHAAAAAAAHVSSTARRRATALSDAAAGCSGLLRRCRHWWKQQLQPKRVAGGYEEWSGSDEEAEEQLAASMWPGWGTAVVAAALTWHAIDLLISFLWWRRFVA